MVTIATGSDPQVLLVKVTGELDIATVDTCRSALDHTLHEASASLRRPSLVVIDLRSLTILSAAGLHMLGEFAVDLNARGITTTIAVQPDSLVRRLLHLAGLDQRLIVLDAPRSADAADRDPPAF